MKLKDTVGIALKGATGNKLRAFLTILGVVIGVGAVIAVMSIGAGASAAITAQIESIGTNLIFVRPGATNTGGVRTAQGTAQSLTLQDANAIADAAPDVAAVSPEVNSFSQIKYGNINAQTRISGATPAYQTVNNSVVVNGRFIIDQDLTSRMLVVVLGSTVAATLFGESDPIDQTILIRNLPFHVVGVLAPKGGTGLGLADDIAVVPLTTAQTRLGASRTTSGGQTIQSITIQGASKDSLDAAKLEIAAVLRERHKIATGATDDFTLTTQDDLVAARTQVTNVLTILLGSVAGISLVVGGIGIMNIMLVTVSERTREIGLRKAIGARRRDILAQFLTEATMLSVSGGALGVAAGWGASLLLARLSLNGQQVQTLVSPTIALVAMGVAVGIGLFFGIYPAIRASRLDPIEALRHQ